MGLKRNTTVSLLTLCVTTAMPVLAQSVGLGAGVGAGVSVGIATASDSAQMHTQLDSSQQASGQGSQHEVRAGSRTHVGARGLLDIVPSVPVAGAIHGTVDTATAARAAGGGRVKQHAKAATAAGTASSSHAAVNAAAKGEARLGSN